MTTQMTDLEKFTLTVAEQDAHGAPVAFGGVPVWVGDNDAVATVLAASDGVTAVVSSVGSGSMTVTVSVDGLSAVYNVSVIAAPGMLTLTASAPEPK